MGKKRLNNMDERISLMTDDELVEEYVSLNLWKNTSDDDWGTGDWGHMNSLNSELDKRPHISSKTIQDLYEEAFSNAQEVGETVYYTRERFLEDTKEIFG